MIYVYDHRNKKEFNVFKLESFTPSQFLIIPKMSNLQKIMDNAKKMGEDIEDLWVYYPEILNKIMTFGEYRRKLVNLNHWSSHFTRMMQSGFKVGRG